MFWGALAALVIVLILTPAVGRAARYLRLVDRPAEGERVQREIPRLGGLALFLGIFVPSLAFLPLGGELRGVLIGASVATTVGAIDDFRGLLWWQKLGGQVLAASIPPASVSGCSASRSRSSAIHQVPVVGRRAADGASGSSP